MELRLESRLSGCFLMPRFRALYPGQSMAQGWHSVDIWRVTGNLMGDFCRVSKMNRKYSI